MNKLNNLTWDAIVPLGDACASTIILKSANLRKFAFPFDWVVSFPKTTLFDLQNNFEYLLGKDKKQYSHYQKFEKEEINKIFQNRINRFNNLLNSNLNLIFFYSNWARISTNTLNLIKSEDEQYLLQIIQHFKEKNAKNIQYIFTNVNNSFEQMREKENISLLDINLEIDLESKISPLSRSQMNFDLKDVEGTFKNTTIEKLKSLNLNFSEYKGGEDELNQNISTEWW
jgi:hypothetical protein